MLRQGLVILSAAVLLGGCGSCPSKEKVAEIIKPVIPVKFDVLAVTPMQQVSGLCQVVVKVDKQVIVLYIDRKGKYLVSGSVISLADKKNLTIETQRKYLQK